VSSELFPSNTASSYRTKLPDALELDGNWEVGLKEIIFPHSWPNLSPQISIFFLTVRTDTKCGNVQTSRSKMDEYQNEMVDAFVEFRKDYEYSLDMTEVRLREGFYENEREILKSVCDQYKTLFPYTATKHEKSNGDITPEISFNFVESELRASIESKHQIAFFSVPTDLGNLLGFIPSLTVSISDKTINRNSLNLYVLPQIAPTTSKPILLHQLPALYVYTDIIQAHIVGDVYAECLRTVAVKGRPRETLSDRFDKPNYFPVSRNYISEILIKITDDQGIPINFRSGKIIVTLHFRRIFKL
jgi:hypothetical protein